MKKYNIQNYIKYKDDVKQSINRLEGKFWDEYTRDERFQHQIKRPE